MDRHHLVGHPVGQKMSVFKVAIQQEFGVTDPSIPCLIYSHLYKNGSNECGSRAQYQSGQWLE